MASALLVALAKASDSGLPKISILYPKNNAVVRSPLLVEFEVSTQDPYIRVINYRIDEGEWENIYWINYTFYELPNEAPPGSFQEYHGTLNITGLSDGYHTIRIEAATDGNGYNRGDSLMVGFTVDTITPPRVRILSPEPLTYNVSEIPLRFALEEPVSEMFYSLDGQANVTLTNNATLADLSGGRHNLVVYAIVGEGLTGASAVRVFGVAPPSIPTSTPTPSPSPSPTSTTKPTATPTAQPTSTPQPPTSPSVSATAEPSTSPATPFLSGETLTVILVVVAVLVVAVLLIMVLEKRKH
ncbi:MAG: hypothetical protein NWF05_05505 [Candidatus Bathyarchaeota archaeon]|nr:hypothetical protein [Candidatus Bathyarchaeota archaeon]